MQILFIFFVSCLGPRAYGNSNIDNMVNAYMNFSYDSFDQRVLKKHVNRVQNFIKNNKKSSTRKAKKYQALLSMHAAALNYIAISNALKDCQDNQRNLSVRIVTAVGLELKNKGLLEVPCETGLESFESIDKFVTSIAAITGPLAESQLQKEITKRASLNGLDSLIDHRFRFLNFAYKDDESILQTVRDLCLVRPGCEETLYNSDSEKSGEMFKRGKQIAKRLQRQLKNKKYQRFSKSTGATHLNKQINQLNKTLDAASDLVKYDDGLVNDDPIFTSESSLLHQMYQSQYRVIAFSDPVGRLLNSDILRDKVGLTKKEEEGDMSEEGSSFRFEKHMSVKADDIEKAIKEVDQKIIDQVYELNKKNYYQDFREKSLKGSQFVIEQTKKDLITLVKTNPVAVGQQLLSHPEYAPLVCDVINGVTQNDKDDESSDEVWFWGGIVAGGVLSLTVFGAGVGAWILAGTTTGASLASLAVGTSLVGVAVGIAETGYHGSEYFESKHEQNMLEGALLSGGGDKYSVDDANAALEEFREAKYHTIVAGLFTGIELGALAAATKAGLFGARLTKTGNALDRVNTMSKLLNRITESPRYTSAVIGLKKTLGGKKIARLLGALSQSSEVLRIKMLNKLSDWFEAGQLSRAQAVIEEALEIAKKSCKIS